MTANNKKTIILFYPPYTLYLPKITDSLATYPEINFEIIKILRAEDEYDTPTLEEFIKLVSAQIKPPTLIIDHNVYISLPQHMLTWSVLGTLSIASLIDEVYVYQGMDASNVAILKKAKPNYLSFSFFYFQKTLASMAFANSLFNN